MSNVVFQNIPNRKDVANGSSQNKEMEHGMHVRTLVEGIEQGSGDVADPFANDPTHGMRADGIHQRFEGNQYYQSHQAIADGFQMTMFLELAETDASPDNGAKPYKAEERPSPIPLFAQGHQCDGGVASRNVPIDGCMVKLSCNSFCSLS